MSTTQVDSATQAVSTASEDAQSRYWKLHDRDPDFSLCEYNFIAAAALRAAADEVAKWESAAAAAKALLSIANELEEYQ